jgi:hypothetical protein
MEKPKLNFTLLKKLVTELEVASDLAEKVREGKKLYESEADYNNFVVEVSKVAGLCTSVSTEALALVKDCQQLLKFALMPERSTNDFGLADLLSGYMPSGDNGSGNLGN